MENAKSEYYSLALAPTALDFEKGEVEMPNELPAVPGVETQWKER